MVSESRYMTYIIVKDAIYMKSLAYIYFYTSEFTSVPTSVALRILQTSSSVHSLNS